MAWIYRRNNSGFWWIGTRANGRLICKSTGETKESKAKEQLATLEAMEAAQRAGRLNRDFFEALTGAHIEVKSLFDCLDVWLKETTNQNTRRNYDSFAKQLKEALPHNPALLDITHEQVRAFLAGIRAKKQASTANLGLACAKAFFGRFKGSLRKDPTEDIPRFKRDVCSVKREAFTAEQIRQVMAIASPFWRCASAIAFYSGLRLSDIAMLKVGDFNPTAGKLTVTTTKTGAKICVQLPAAVTAMVRAEVQPGAKPGDYIWPEQAKHAESCNVTNLSDQFSTLLINAGIRERRASAGHGKTGRRNMNALTFHSLRHSFVSALANAGVNQQTVKNIVGHASDRINDAYTHIGQDTMDRAVALLPDITVQEVTK
jgi:integrase